MTILKTNLAMILLLLASTGLYAQTTYVPDDNFEQALIDLGYDDVLDDSVLTANINTVGSLGLISKNINDLTGIEDFAALVTLFCTSNNLTSLDVSNNTALMGLYCNENNLTSLDVSNNAALETLFCGGNNLTSLDISSCTALKALDCSVNNLTSLNVSTNTALTDLVCRQNNLSGLNVSNCTNLTALECQINNLTNLDVSANATLLWLVCNDNLLTGLNVKNGNNQAFIEFNSTNNPNLTCIEVDDAAYSSANWTNIDPQQYFSENCSVGVNEFTSNTLVVYPNPAQDFFQIKTERAVQKVTIYNMLGKAVAKFNPQEKYNVSNLNRGIYFVSIRLNKKTLNQKILID